MYLNNKKFYESCDYIPKVLGINNNENNINIRDYDFIKIQNVQKLNLINEQPLVLFKKKNYKSYKLENQKKKI